MSLTSNAIKNPGLRTLPPGVERYLIQGGGINTAGYVAFTTLSEVELTA